MKKIIGLSMICLQLLLVSSGTILVSAADTNYVPIVMDFEDVGTKTLAEYLTAKEWKTAGTGLSIENSRLKIDGSAGSPQIQYLKELYKKETYPNTKFVMEFTQQIENVTTASISNIMPLVKGKASDGAAKVLLRGELSKDYKLTHYTDVNGSVSGVTPLSEVEWKKFAGYYTDKKDVHFTHVFDFETEKQTTYANEAIGASLPWAHRGAVTVDDITLGAYGGNTVYYDDIKFYAVDNTFAMENSSLNGAVDVAIDQELVFSFNNPILVDSLSGIVLRAGNKTLNLGDEYTVTSVADAYGLNKQVRIELKDNLAYNTAYTIEFPAQFKDIARQTLKAPETIRFSTGLDSVKVSDAKFVVHDKDGNLITQERALKSGDTVKAMANLTNKSQNPKKYLVVMTVYKGDKMVDIAVKSGNIILGNETVETAPVTIEEDGCTASIMVWESWSGFKPNKKYST